MSIRLTKAQEEKMLFANFCINEKLKPYDAACLVHLAHAVCNAARRRANKPNVTEKSVDAVREQLQNKAKELGYDTDFTGGCWPCLVKNGQDVNIPA